MKIDRDLLIELAFVRSKSFTLFQRAELFRRFGALQPVLQLSQERLAELGFTEAQKTFFRTLHDDLDSFSAVVEDYSRKQYHKVSVTESGRYPSRLLQIPDYPWLLFYKGDASLLLNKPAIAVVGSRRMTEYGRRVIEKLIPPLVEAGVTVVSGMASGVDAWAEQTALNHGGKVIAVQAQGVDRGYPRSQEALYRRVVANGLVVSEFAESPEYVGPEMFPRRNRIISGLSDGVLVIEAAEKSGSLVTAYLGLEQNRNIYAVPGDIDREMSRGCHKILKQGAKPVVDAEDILEDLFVPTERTFKPMQESPLSIRAPEFATELEKSVYGICLKSPATLDELVESSGISAARLAPIIMTMELEGKLKTLPGGRYAA